MTMWRIWLPWACTPSARYRFATTAVRASSKSTRLAWRCRGRWRGGSSSSLSRAGAAPDEHGDRRRISAHREAVAAESDPYALLGHPNTGRTTLFNRLCGLRARTANYPGTTSSIRLGVCSAGNQRFSLVDLPGTYALDLQQPESRICRGYIENGRAGRDKPDAVLIVADGCNVGRSLVSDAVAL